MKAARQNPRRKYVHLRVRLKTENGRKTVRTYWAVPLGQKGAIFSYLIVNAEGESHEYIRKDGVTVGERRLLLATESEIVWERPAHMSLHYGWLVEDEET